MIHPLTIPCRATIPAIEALEAAGNPVARGKPGEPVGVELRRPPKTLIVAQLRSTGSIALRTEEEPPWDGAMRPSWDVRGLFVGCPECGESLVWAEAGFVPGWRICLSGHACMLARDGASATRRPDQDEATLATTRPL